MFGDLRSEECEDKDGGGGMKDETSLAQVERLIARWAEAMKAWLKWKGSSIHPSSFILHPWRSALSPEEWIRASRPPSPGKRMKRSLFCMCLMASAPSCVSAALLKTSLIIIASA